MKTVLVTGYSKVPINTIIYEHNKAIGVVLEIEKETGIIIDADIMFVTELARKFFKKEILGLDIVKDGSLIIKIIEEDFLIPSQKAVVSAFRTAQQRYIDYSEKD